MMSTCTDPNCPENCKIYSDYAIYKEYKSNKSTDNLNDNRSEGVDSINRDSVNASDCNLTMNFLNDMANRKESIDSQELLLSNMNTVSITENDISESSCTDESCQKYRENNSAAAEIASTQQSNRTDHNEDTNGHQTSHEFCDPLINYNDYYNEPTNENQQQQHEQQQFWNTNEAAYSDMQHSHDFYDLNKDHDECQQKQSYQQENDSPVILGHHSQYLAMLSAQSKSDYSMIPTDITSNKSSKEIYKSLAKQCGITCKMSDGCRCMECQSHYFDCEFDENEHQKTDGGLGAGTPMFISEVMHGTACNVL